MKKRAARPPGPRPKIEPHAPVTPVAPTPPSGRRADGLPKRSRVDVTPETIRFIESLSDSEIRSRLTEQGVHRNVVEDLVRLRSTIGARWRLIQELG